VGSGFDTLFIGYSPEDGLAAVSILGIM
jgi:hypothetical protein